MNKKKVTKKKSVTKTNQTKTQETIKSPELVRYIVQRFELNDPTLPAYYIIGFKLICDLNQRDYYVETQLLYNDCVNKSDNEICVMAYNKLKSKISEVSRDLLLKKFIIGSEFVPPKN